jgi:hypothetical protein
MVTINFPVLAGKNLVGINFPELIVGAILIALGE